MKKSGIISCILLLTAFFSAGTTNAQSIVLTPKWTAQAQFAGYYVAEKMGFYKEEGLDVAHTASFSLRKFLFFSEEG